MRSSLAFVGVLPVVALAGAASAGVAHGIEMQVHAASGPSYNNNSPSWGGFSDNGLFALRNGLASYGGSIYETPTAYERAGDVVNIGDLIMSSSVSGFHTWRGVSEPSGAFAEEYGNSMNWGIAAVGTGGFQFSLSQLTFSADAEGQEWADEQDFGFDYATSSYTATRVGVLVGADGLLNTSDDVLITSGASTQLVDAYYSRGPYWGWYARNQGELDWLLGRGGYTQTGLFTFTTGIGTFSTSDSISVVPAPGALALLGLAGLARRRRLQPLPPRSVLGIKIRATRH